MYLEDVCTIKKTDDGKFVVQVMPERKKEKPGKPGEVAPAMMGDPKSYVAGNMDELHSLIDEYIGGKKKTEKDKFKKGFESK